jgi:hypothetical protein
MMVVMLVAGFGFVLAGLSAIGYGIQYKEFSVGSTLIESGVIGVCTGAIMLGLWMAVRELKNVARRLGAGVSAEPHAEVAVPALAPAGAPRPAAPGEGGFLFNRDEPAAEHAGRAEHAAPSAPPPWHEEAASRDRPRGEAPPEAEPAEAAPAVKPKRNLLFSSSSRKERERAQTRTSEPLPPDILSPELRPNPPAAPPPPEASEAPPATFDAAWPKSERPRPGEPVPPRRSPRPPSAAPSTFSENAAVGGNEDQPQVTVLKSGVVDGMAYSLYSDGSIEAQMPEGMMRFASIDELRSHLDQRP